jgi:hypothetical protein
MTIDTPSITIASRSLALAWCLLSLITRHPSAKLVRIDVVIHSRARNLSFGFMPSAINSRRASLSNARQRLQFLASNERASKYLPNLCHRCPSACEHADTWLQTLIPSLQRRFQGGLRSSNPKMPSRKSDAGWISVHARTHNRTSRSPTLSGINRVSKSGGRHRRLTIRMQRSIQMP